MIFRFADVFGLDLADVKTFLDEVPKVPKSAYLDLKDAELSDLDSDSSSEKNFPVGNLPKMNVMRTSAATNLPKTTLVPMFNQPGGFPNFFDLLRDKKVCLENAYMSDPRSLKGTIRVHNVSFHKSVTIRYTTNEWMDTTDLEAFPAFSMADG